MASAARLTHGILATPSAFSDQPLSNHGPAPRASTLIQPAWNKNSNRMRSKGMCVRCKAEIAERDCKESNNSSAGTSTRRVLLSGLLVTGLSLAGTSPAQAGILSGSQGLEQAGAPELPEVPGLFKQIKEGNKKRQDDLDSSFEASDLLKQLRKKSEDNREKNKKEILDKYCVRGSEWGVGDCAVKGLPESAESSQSTRKLIADAIDKLRGK